ncbi:hypothetical protein ACFQV8_06795 [Pseudonocardia benzenivorans]
MQDDPDAVDAGPLRRDEPRPQRPLLLGGPDLAFEHPHEHPDEHGERDEEARPPGPGEQPVAERDGGVGTEDRGGGEPGTERERPSRPATAPPRSAAAIATSGNAATSTLSAPPVHAQPTTTSAPSTTVTSQGGNGTRPRRAAATWATA